MKEHGTQSLEARAGLTEQALVAISRAWRFAHADEVVSYRIQHIAALPECSDGRIAAGAARSHDGHDPMEDTVAKRFLCTSDLAQLHVAAAGGESAARH